MKKLFFIYSCVEIYSLLSEFGSFMSKSLLLLNYQSDNQQTCQLPSSAAGCSLKLVDELYASWTPIHHSS